MWLTRECDYAFVVLAFLARQERGRILSCDEMADLLNIPYDFLAKILQKLCRAGLTASRQGAHGGYALARSPSVISFADVFRAIDDPLLLVECVEPQSCRCPRLPVCTIAEPMRLLHQRLALVFGSMTVADLLGAPCGDSLPRVVP